MAPAFVELAAVQDLVPSGAFVALGGMTLYRRPVALVREVLRGSAADLRLLTFTGGFETDLLVGAGRLAQLHSCYVGLEGFGLAPMFTARATAGDLTLVEETEATLGLGLRAALARLDFLPHRGLLGTDLPRVRPDLATVASPYGGDEYLAIPALRPEVALLHAVRADRAGNLYLGGNHCLDLALAQVAGRVVATVEEVVDELDAAEVDVVGGDVTEVIECPQGAAPTSCWPRYGVRGTHLLEYLAAAREGRFGEYLEAFLRPGVALTDLGHLGEELGLPALVEASAGAA